MSFKPFGEAVQLRFMEMSQGELYVVNADDIFERYLAAFPEGTNPFFRQRTEHDCQCCKQFIRRLGVVVAIKDGQVITIWGGHNLGGHYEVVAEALDDYIGTLPIESVFRTTEKQYGAAFNYDEARQRYEHFVGQVGPKHCMPDADTKRGEKNSAFQVLNRGLKEFREEDFEAVLDLIDNNQLYKGGEFKAAIVSFQALLEGYKASKSQSIFAWEHINNPFAGFRNTAIGTLFQDLAGGKELEHAVNAYEAKVSSNTYKRPTPVITQRMLEQAVQTLHDANLTSMTQRRYARISDITVENVLFVDRDERGKMKGGIEALLEGAVTKSKPDLKHAILVPAEKFIAEILPGSKCVEALVENRHTGNFVSLTGADGPERPFKWSNNFAWSYEGNVTDSVKQRVKAAGGNVRADLRISLSWFNKDDLDIHATTPYGYIYYREKMNILDVDMNAGEGRTRTPVENLAFMRPKDGQYKVLVNNFCRREAIDYGFAIEIECNGVLHQYSHPKGLRDKEDVSCFVITMKGGKIEKIDTVLVGGSSSQDKWGIKTETLVPVTVIAYSPNYWGDNKVGAKHTIFGLRGCINPEPTRGIYNEYLRADLDKHRKVLEVLGEKTKCKPTDDQVSGIGFTAARGDTVTVAVDGRPYTLSF